MDADREAKVPIVVARVIPTSGTGPVIRMLRREDVLGPWLERYATADPDVAVDVFGDWLREAIEAQTAGEDGGDEG